MTSLEKSKIDQDTRNSCYLCFSKWDLCVFKDKIYCNTCFTKLIHHAVDNQEILN